jgi:toxin ParE1/3/4
MTCHPFQLSRRAEHDIRATLDDYITHFGQGTAQRFVHHLREAMDRLAFMPGIGFPRWAQALGIPGIRTWPLRRYPAHLFYTDCPAPLMMLRVLHARQHIRPALLPP